MHKILLAEDDNDMRRFLVKALENAGFQVSPHDNGMSAYQRLREEPFEMLLTDIVMPEMDGIELARRASELDPDIKIMFITGFAAVALNSDSEAPEKRQGAVQAGPSSRIGQRSEQDAGGLIRARFHGVEINRLGNYPEASLRGRFGADIRTPPNTIKAGAGWSSHSRARSSAGEHYLDMVGVTGSIPVAPTSLRLLRKLRLGKPHSTLS